MEHKKAIPYSRQWITETDIDTVVKVLRSDFITQGRYVGKFEIGIAKYCGVKYAVAFSSGTAALHGAAYAAGIGKGDEVITSPMTFAASANCVLYCGGTPVFADIQSSVMPLIDPEEIEKKITKKTKAIIPIDFAGIPADYDEINKIAQKHKLAVIADAAHSLGAAYKKKKVGTLADMTVFSFHPVKLITAGEGGMVVTNNRDFFNRLIMFRTHGVTKDKSKLQIKNDGGWYYEMQELGYNYRLTDVQAALGLSQTKNITQFVKMRSRIAEKYIDKLSTERIYFLPHDATKKSAWHIFPILLRKNYKQHRKKLFQLLREMGVKVQVHYIPTHLHPYYRKHFGYKSDDFPEAERYYKRTISLPLYPKLKVEEQTRVIKMVNALLKKLK